MRYVVLYHRCESSHFDIMIESGDRLDTWRAARAALAGILLGFHSVTSRLDPHRREYLDYEGPISCDRGNVCLFDSGICRSARTAGEVRLLELQGLLITGTLSISPYRADFPVMALRWKPLCTPRRARALSRVLKFSCNREGVH